MHWRNKFRNKEDIKLLLNSIKSSSTKDIKIMEVCGTHTMAIAEAGIRELLPQNIRLVSGPGCPVCVTPAERVDDVYNIFKNNDVIIATYGDMIRVPGTKKGISLEMARMEGADIRIVYSSMDALEIARENPLKQIVFLGVGFETTAPATAAVIIEASHMGIENFCVLSMHKTMENVMRHLLDSDEIKVDGFLLPGHVSVILGTHGFDFLQNEYKVPAVVSGFEPVDILKAILLLVKQIEGGTPEVDNEYTRVVSPIGNTSAQNAINRVFEPCDDIWRGFGVIKSSGLKIRDEYKKFDAVYRLNIKLCSHQGSTPCRCGDILKGIIEPWECPLFGRECIPDSPVGPCMVSSEGSCAAAYKYR